MTDRIRFERKAVADGAIILESVPTILKIQSSDRVIITTKYFDEEGNLTKLEIERVNIF